MPKSIVRMDTMWGDVVRRADHAREPCRLLSMAKMMHGFYRYGALPCGPNRAAGAPLLKCNKLLIWMGFLFFFRLPRFGFAWTLVDFAGSRGWRTPANMK